LTNRKTAPSSGRRTVFPIAKSCVAGMLLWVSAGMILGISGSHSAYAHKVVVFAWVEGDNVHTESSFGSNKPVKGGRITVLNTHGVTVLSGITDEEGRFSFPLPAETGLKILLDAGPGHRGEWVLHPPEVPFREKQEPSAVSEEPEERMSSGASPVSGSANTVAPEELEDLLETLLDRKLQPIMGQLARLQNPGPSLKDILGGLGYLFGLVGVALYAYHRRASGSS